MSKKVDKTVDIEVFPVQEESLSPAEFMELVEKNPSLIRRSAMVFPRLGDPGFGGFHVEYTRPRYKAMPHFKPVAK